MSIILIMQTSVDTMEAKTPAAEARREEEDRALVTIMYKEFI